MNYNFGHGWYVYSAPVITANWLPSGNDASGLPIGGGAGLVVKFGGKLPVNLQLGAYANVFRPQYNATWTLRTEIAVFFNHEYRKGST